MKCSLFFLLFLPLTLAATKKDEIEKKISREFKIQPNGYLVMDNKYGSIDIAIGQPNEIKMDVVITVKASNEKKAQEAIDRISVEFEEGQNRVRAKTSISSSSGWTSWWGNNNIEMDIDYKVLVPADIYLDLVNKYGDIYVETTNRDMRIDLSYGDIRLGDVNAKLSLEMAYSNGALSRIHDGILKLSYSDLEMEDGQLVEIDMQYSDLVMGSAIRLKLLSAFSDLQGMDIDEVSYAGKYDDLAIERVKSIDAKSAYSGMEIDGMSQRGNFDMQYGDLHINNIGPGFSKLNITTSYTGVDLVFLESTGFTIDAQNNYCDIQHSGLKVTEDIQRTTSTIFKASRGSGTGLVVVRMNYGELSIE